VENVARRIITYGQRKVPVVSRTSQLNPLAIASLLACVSALLLETQAGFSGSDSGLRQAHFERGYHHQETVSPPR